MSTVKNLGLVQKSGAIEIFRQTRQSNQLNNLTMQIGSKSVDLKNWSRTGIGFETRVSENSFKVDDRVEGVQILCQGISVYEGSITIRSIRTVAPDTVFYGASFVSSLFLTEGIESAMSVNLCIETTKKVVQEMHDIKPEFCRSVVALRSVLREIKKACQAEERRWSKLPFDRRCEAERVFLPRMTESLKSTFFQFNADIATQIDVEKLPPNSSYHRVFREEVYPLFEGADLVRRAYEKPRGYAGDYEMMNQIYRNGYEGDDLFGRVLHNYIANENSGDSVKFRKPYFVSYYDRLLKRPGNHSVLSVACGPAVEVQELVTVRPQSDLDRLNLTLFDLDREALEHAQSKIYDCSVRLEKRPNLTFINASVKSFLTSNAETNEKYDFIYSGGLFDYLDNVTSAALVRRFVAMMNQGGILIIGNFTKENTTKAFLHLLTDWALIHKTEEEMKRWADGVDGVSVSVEYDPGGINAFLVVKKDAVV